MLNNSYRKKCRHVLARFFKFVAECPPAHRQMKLGEAIAAFVASVSRPHRKPLRTTRDHSALIRHILVGFAKRFGAQTPVSKIDQAASLQKWLDTNR